MSSYAERHGVKPVIYGPKFIDETINIAVEGAKEDRFFLARIVGDAAGGDVPVIETILDRNTHNPTSVEKI